MEGYYGRERHETFTADGWYRTGDLFHVDDEGFFYFTGRRGDMIKTAGANVSPREVEAASRDVTGGLAATCRADDADGGSSLRRRSAAEPDAAPRSTRCAPRCARALRLQGAAAVPRARDDEVPMLSSGKLDMPAIRSVRCRLRSGRDRPDRAGLVRRRSDERRPRAIVTDESRSPTARSSIASRTIAARLPRWASARARRSDS